MDYSYFGDLFDSDGAWHRVWVLLAMLGVVPISQVSGEVRTSEAAWPPLVFAGMYAVLAYGYLRAHRANPALRALTRRYVVVMLTAGLLAALAVGLGLTALLWLGTATLVGIVAAETRLLPHPGTLPNEAGPRRG